MSGGRRRDRTSVRLSTQPWLSKPAHCRSASLPQNGGLGWIRTSTDRALNAVTLPVGLRALIGAVGAIRTHTAAPLKRVTLPIGLPRRKFGPPGIRTQNLPVLSRLPLPVELRGHNGGRGRDRTCLRLTARVFETRGTPLCLPFQRVQLLNGEITEPQMSRDSITGWTVVGIDGPCEVRQF